MNLANLIPGARRFRPNPAKADILRLHAEGRTVPEIVRLTGATRNAVSGTLRLAGLRIHLAHPERAERVPHDESRECYTRALAYRLVGLGATDAEIAFECGVSVDEARAYRADCPKGWGNIR